MNTPVLSGLPSMLGARPHAILPSAAARPPGPPPLQLPSRQDTVELSEGAPGTKAHTLKMLLEETFGKEADSASAAVTQAQPRAVADLKAGDSVSISEARAMSVTVMHASATQVTLSAEVDGRRLEIRATRVSIEYLRIEAITVQEQDPLVLDIAGDGINLRSVEDGVSFDIDGDGGAEKTGFVQGDDALLVYDRRSDAKVTGEDLMGNHHGAVNGFEELRRFDDNADGRIDASDAIYAKLRTYQDLNGDGRVQDSELRTLADVGVAAINLDYDTSDEVSGGQRITETGTFERADGSIGKAADALFKYQEINA